MEITGSVGMGCVNNRNDVLVVQDALKKKAFPELAVDGIIGPQTISAIRTFQRKFLRQPDGIISVGGTTAQQVSILVVCYTGLVDCQALQLVEAMI